MLRCPLFFSRSCWDADIAGFGDGALFRLGLGGKDRGVLLDKAVAIADLPAGRRLLLALLALLLGFDTPLPSFVLAMLVLLYIPCRQICHTR